MMVIRGHHPEISNCFSFVLVTSHHFSFDPHTKQLLQSNVVINQTYVYKSVESTGNQFLQTFRRCIDFSGQHASASSPALGLREGLDIWSLSYRENLISD